MMEDFYEANNWDRGMEEEGEKTRGIKRKPC
jgi:hypothetical protein